MGELHEKYQQRLAETTSVHSTEMTNLRTGFDAAVEDNNGLMTTLCLIIIIIIINEFHRDASLTKTSGPLCVTCFTSVNGTVAGSVRCRTI